ncbi:methyltransferase domain-containing protein [Erythrobacteraceae bacterium CFH 75059]|uniref:RsmB/NOP family class I SAM-dependent RNA methyltransferase n=1 Tax=Qipengyuania thermophila TaxID=2509361 RepID=UPI0010202B69|nr:methyltransferase domain-containing protein [Qipengyuania thermophila]TCD06397.1 methyltransferase domain-containing protein [Erythrobacteraceae bacterium CFH 75059]
MDTVPGTAARLAALKLLDAVLRRGETLDQAGAAALSGLAHPADKALARAIAGEALRWLVDLDHLIDGATARPLPPDAKARTVLRLMLAQSLRLGMPAHAVVATGLPLLTGGPRRLAHGVFAALVRRGVQLPPAPTLPQAVRARWGAMAEAVAPALREPPPLDLTLKDAGATALWAARLGRRSLAPGHVRLERGRAVPDLPGFGEGAWWVQDLAASLPARLLGEGAGRRVLDLAAAPGGKTLQLASRGWEVTALDASARRLGRLRDNLARTGLRADLICADALAWHAAEPFDAVLLDAPCTATGTCRRNPDVLHRIDAAAIARMAGMQEAMLRRARAHLRPGGVLVYAVCSLEREEGEEQAARVDAVSLPVAADELPAGLRPDALGRVRTHPGMLAEEGGLDGFFIARWRG